MIFSTSPLIILAYSPSSRQVQREWVGWLSTRHDKIGYQKLCFSNSQRDRFSVFLLYLDGRAFYLVKWNCNYSVKTYQPCPESLLVKKCWVGGRPCEFSHQDWEFICLALLSVLFWIFKWPLSLGHIILPRSWWSQLWTHYCFAEMLFDENWDFM